MKLFLGLLLFLSMAAGPAFSAEPMGDEVRMVLLHHSTGENVWNGGVGEWFTGYNEREGKNYQITERAFPKDSPYGWENYPYDYWNLWVRHAGMKPFKEEPTLELLTRDYDVIVWKHCFPVSDIEEDTGSPDIGSAEKRIENYKLQYEALKEKMRQFPAQRFVVWTGAAQVKSSTTPEQAARAKAFFEWVRSEWDEKGDNIYVWDFRELETEGGLYVKPAYAAGREDSHPNETFSRRVAPLLAQRIVSVIQGTGDETDIKGIADRA
ncbi:MAG: hypothetical protein ACOY3K_02870 [Candidatus Omnitrophota bacterium]